VSEEKYGVEEMGEGRIRRKREEAEDKKNEKRH
jgi:hypothetical protein